MNFRRDLRLRQSARGFVGGGFYISLGLSKGDAKPLMDNQRGLGSGFFIVEQVAGSVHTPLATLCSRQVEGFTGPLAQFHSAYHAGLWRGHRVNQAAAEFFPQRCHFFLCVAAAIAAARVRE